MSTSSIWVALASALLLATPGCASGGSSSPASSTTSSSPATPAASVCTPGMDQTCNDNPEISSLHGTCRPDGTCECKGDFEKNEATGRCK